MKNFWPLVLLAAVYGLLAGGCFYCGYSFSIWIGIFLSWITFGVLCWIALLRYYPPNDAQPSVADSLVSADDNLPGTQEGSPFSIRDVPEMFVLMIVNGMFAPILLAYLWRTKTKDKAEKHKKGAS